MERDKLIKKAYDLGFYYEQRYHGCAQCTIGGIQDALGVRNDFVFKAGGGFSAGCGMLRDGPCGGYTGGIMVMSTFFARQRELIDDDREENYCSLHMAIKLHERFIKAYETIICRDIHERLFGRSYDLWNAEEKKLFEDMGAHRDKCTAVVARGASWATEIILDEIEKRSLQLSDFTNLICISK